MFGERVCEATTKNCKEERDVVVKAVVILGFWMSVKEVRLERLGKEPVTRVF